MWHAQITSLTVRLYDGAARYADKAPFVGVAQVELLGDGIAFIHGALRSDGQPLSLRQWRDLGRLLRDDFGVLRIDAERSGQRISYDTIRL